MKKQGKKLVLKHQNTQIKLPKYGSFTLKFISVGDWNHISEFLNQKISNRDFVVQILFKQITDNKIKLSDFKKIPPNDLDKVGKAFVKNEKYTFKYFKDTGNFVKDFKRAIEDYNKEWHKKSLNMFNSMVDFDSVLRAQKQMEDLIESTTLFNKTIFEEYKKATEAFNSMADKYFELLSDVASRLKTQFSVWSEFDKQYQKNSKKALNNLKKYNWFINNTMPASIVGELAKVKDAKEIKNIFIEYHFTDKYFVLDSYLEKWAKNKLFSKRIKILKDTLILFKQENDNKKININSIVIPILINQIEGLRYDYLVNKGIKHLGKNSWQCPKTNKTINWKSFYTEFVNGEDRFTQLGLQIFLDILFQEEGTKKFINFSRHKISHGQIVNYGRDEIVVRCFMILDFISELN